MQLEQWIDIHGLSRWTKKATAPSISVTLLDTGIDAHHPDIEASVGDIKNFYDPGEPAEDLDGHGTFCAGVIAGSGILQCKGVSPEIKVHIGKITQLSTFEPLPELLTTALSWAAERSDVICLPFGSRLEDEDIRLLTQKIAQKGVIIVSSLGRTDEWHPDGCFPALYPEVIAVGTVDDQNVITSDSVLSPAIDICVPSIEMKGCLPEKKGRVGVRSGPGIGSAMIAGLAVMYKSAYPEGNYKGFRQYLKSQSEKYTLNRFTYSCFKHDRLDSFAVSA
ncbi:MAG: S8 family serine peptidase [Flavobacteriales bacterium]|nr:S8 family serine peptidase [Flavobacteriales bacterium]